MKLFRFWFALILLTSVSFAQEEDKRTTIHGGAGYFMPGIQILSIGDLNSKLESKQYPKLSSSFTSFGGGGHAIIYNFVVGGEGHGLVGKDVSNNNYTINLSSGYGIFDLGYVIFSKYGVLIYPMIGIGGYGNTFQITERTIPTFDEILDNPKGHLEVSTGGLLLHFALGLDYMISFNSSGNSRGGILLGLRAGLTFTPVAGDWKIAETKVAGGPETGATGAYIRLLIGGGGYTVKEK